MTTQQLPPPDHSKSNPELSAADHNDFICTRKRSKSKQEDFDPNIWMLEHGTCGLEELLQKTVRQVLSTELAQINDSLKNITAAITAITYDNNAIKTTLNNVNSRLDEMDKTLNYSDERQHDFDTRLKIIEDNCTQYTHKTKNCELATQVSYLEDKMNEMDQEARQNNLEISGIPESSKDDLSLYFRNIINVLGVKINESDIIHLTRIRSFNTASGRPRAIVIKLTSRTLRDTVLSAVRAKKGLKLADIGLRGDDRIFVNEHLTPANKQLFKHTKEKAKAVQYKYIWMRDGKIFVRKNDTSPALRIKNRCDIEKIA